MRNETFRFIEHSPSPLGEVLPGSVVRLSVLEADGPRPEIAVAQVMSAQDFVALAEELESDYGALNPRDLSDFFRENAETTVGADGSPERRGILNFEGWRTEFCAALSIEDVLKTAREEVSSWEERERECVRAHGEFLRSEPPPAGLAEAVDRAHRELEFESRHAAFLEWERRPRPGEESR